MTQRKIPQKRTIYFIEKNYGCVELERSEIPTDERIINEINEGSARYGKTEYEIIQANQSEVRLIRLTYSNGEVEYVGTTKTPEEAIKYYTTDYKRLSDYNLYQGFEWVSVVAAEEIQGSEVQK